jgi:hypothetical protein
MLGCFPRKKHPDVVDPTQRRPTGSLAGVKAIAAANDVTESPALPDLPAARPLPLPHASQWTVEDWVKAQLVNDRVVDAITGALIHPMAQEDRSPSQEKRFLLELGKQGDAGRRQLTKLLQQSSIASVIATVLLERMVELERRPVGATWELQPKFYEAHYQQLQFGDMNDVSPPPLKPRACCRASKLILVRVPAVAARRGPVRDARATKSTAAGGDDA